jgi:hypothetical protein
MSSDDISQIIDRLDRMEGKQDAQAEQIANLRVAVASQSAGNKAEDKLKGSRTANIAAFSALGLVVVEIISRFVK